MFAVNTIMRNGSAYSGAHRAAHRSTHKRSLILSHACTTRQKKSQHRPRKLSIPVHFRLLNVLVRDTLCKLK